MAFDWKTLLGLAGTTVASTAGSAVKTSLTGIVVKVLLVALALSSGIAGYYALRAKSEALAAAETKIATMTSALSKAESINRGLEETLKTLKMVEEARLRQQEQWLKEKQQLQKENESLVKKLPRPSGKADTPRSEADLTKDSVTRLQVLWEGFCLNAKDAGYCLDTTVKDTP